MIPLTPPMQTSYLEAPKAAARANWNVTRSRWKKLELPVHVNRVKFHSGGPDKTVFPFDYYWSADKMRHLDNSRTASRSRR